MQSEPSPDLSDISQVLNPADTLRVWRDTWNDQFLNRVFELS